jgi:hypothetical protein
MSEDALFGLPERPPPPAHTPVRLADAGIAVEASELAEAVDTTLRQLLDDGHLDPKRDAARIALAKSLASVIAHKERTGRASTVGQDAKVLLDLLDGMVPTEAATSADAALQRAMAAWSDAVGLPIPGSES